MTFIILSLSRSHSFPAAQELAVKGKGRKWSIERPKRSSARFCGGNWSSSLSDPQPLLKMAVCCNVEKEVWQTLGKCTCMYEAESARSRQKEEIVCQTICKDFNKLQSQMARNMLQLSLRYVWVTASIINTIRQIVEIDYRNDLGSLRSLSSEFRIRCSMVCLNFKGLYFM